MTLIKELGKCNDRFQISYKKTNVFKGPEDSLDEAPLTNPHAWVDAVEELLLNCQLGSQFSSPGSSS